MWYVLPIYPNEVELSKEIGLEFDSKHILNAQASIRAPCCRRWYDVSEAAQLILAVNEKLKNVPLKCPECHAETADHPLLREVEMVFVCKKCRKAFRKDMTVYDDSDEYCPHCDNHYIVEAKIPQAMLVAEGEDARVDNRCVH